VLSDKCRFHFLFPSHLSLIPSLISLSPYFSFFFLFSIPIQVLNAYAFFVRSSLIGISKLRKAQNRTDYSSLKKEEFPKRKTILYKFKLNKKVYKFKLIKEEKSRKMN